MCRDALKKTCNGLTPMSINLCVDFFMHTYNISSAPNDQERGVRLSYVFGKRNFEHNDIGLVISILQFKQKTVMVDILSNFFFPKLQQSYQQFDMNGQQFFQKLWQLRL